MNTRSLSLSACAKVCVVALAVATGACASKRAQLCDHVRLQDGKISLTKNENVLVCGLPKGSVEGWHEIPVPQAEYQLKVLLQNRGFLHSRFERRGDELDVWLGPREKIAELRVTGDEGHLRPWKKRKIVGEPLVPEKLDEVKEWADTSIRTDGYACGEAAVRAEAWNDTIFADVRTGQRMRIGGIDYSGLHGLDPQSLARHQAMEPGDWYDARETQLTAGRVLNDALFDSAYFTNRCHDDTVDLTLVTSVGKPRIFRFGLGASTEEFPFAQIWFKNARLDNRASSFTTVLYASPREQRLTFNSEIYVVPASKRAYFGPRFFLRRRRESAFEDKTAQLGIDLGRQVDHFGMRWRGRVGPTLNYVKTVRGQGPADSTFVSWDGSLGLTSRDYELFPQDQFSGWQADVSYRGQRLGLGSRINVDRIELGAKKLWNLGHYSPPLFVLGARARGVVVNSTDVDRVRNDDLLPLEYREFMGGDDNLRGFSRKSLSNGDLGYITALYGGLELRLVQQLPFKLEPFLLYDAAQFSARRQTLARPIFLSDGFGLRWPSPVGTLRASAARGRIWRGDMTTDGYPQQWVYFLSFGQEF